MDNMIYQNVRLGELNKTVAFVLYGNAPEESYGGSKFFSDPHFFIAFLHVSDHSETFLKFPPKKFFGVN
jgi:hypothetical protein